MSFILCEQCGQECTIKIQDDSFDHEFGTETVLIPVSGCCDDIPRIVPDDEADEVSTTIANGGPKSVDWSRFREAEIPDNTPDPADYLD